MSYFKKVVKRANQKYLEFKYQSVLKMIQNRHNKLDQITLVLKYQELQRNGILHSNLTDMGSQLYSQTDEDDILLYLFSVIGTSKSQFYW